MSATIPTQIEKCKGAIVATAIGDALGWPNEQRSKNKSKSPIVNDYFVEWTRRCSNPCYHNESILPGEYSDDTQMALSVARSIIAGNWEKFLAEKELPFWLKYERGGGGALLKAAKSCDKGVLLWKSNYTRDYFNAGGNGAAMRILPHVISYARIPDIAALMVDVIKDTIITHGHPRAILGATCYAYALDYLLRKETVLEYSELVYAVIDGQNKWGALPNPELFGNWLDIADQYRGFNYTHEWETVRINMIKQLDFIKTSLKKGLMLDDTKILTQLECFSKANGAGDVAVLAAVYLASRYANNPSLGIKVPAFSFGADTDTIASMTGGLLGMLSGINWIPTEWKAVQDYECLIQIAELLLFDNIKETTKADVLEAKAQESGWINSPIGKMRPIGKTTVKNGEYAIVTITKWQTALGQTLYTKEMQRLENQPYPSENQIPLLHKSAASISIQTPAELEEQQGQFVLNTAVIDTLLNNSQFKKNITIGKVLKIIQALVKNNESVSAVARRFEVDEAMAELIKSCIK
ncbi:MAG: ADP-ribosylglycohydrolase family protein [Defluviitaleaceae bacterium]|nr:ADP-ribosylglycohydrolase family protein [Defluviitaleaceae bacterium]